MVLHFHLLQPCTISDTFPTLGASYGHGVCHARPTYPHFLPWRVTDASPLIKNPSLTRGWLFSHGSARHTKYMTELHAALKHNTTVLGGISSSVKINKKQITQLKSCEQGPLTLVLWNISFVALVCSAFLGHS